MYGVQHPVVVGDQLHPAGERIERLFQLPDRGQIEVVGRDWLR
jgi:hypothetical protein